MILSVLVEHTLNGTTFLGSWRELLELPVQWSVSCNTEWPRERIGNERILLLAKKFRACANDPMSGVQPVRKNRKPRSDEARKPGPSPKWTARIELRLSPEQYEKLERIAKSQRCSRGSLLRAWIAAAAEAPSVAPSN